MKVQLIMLPNQPILVSDEIKESDNLYHPYQPYFFKATLANKEIWKDCKSVIAGIPELPQIDFSTLSEEDCKKIGWVDIQKLGYDRAVERRWHPNSMETRRVANEIIEAVKYGFETAQSLNEKKFTEEDIKKAVEMARGSTLWYGNGGLVLSEPVEEYTHTPQQIIQFLSQPKVFDVEIQLDRTRYPKEDDGWEDVYTPRITDNKIKILKVL